MAQTSIDFSKQLSEEIDGWKKSAEVLTFTPKTLFSYINGGAELYISYNFKTLTSWRYVKGATQEIKVDIFDMGDSMHAFGIFSHGREQDDHKFGQGSEYASGLLNFWKDRYYISILGYPEDAEKRKIIQKIGKRIAQAIPGEGPLPRLISFLPQENLVKDSIRYFGHYAWINTFYFISSDDILHMGKDSQAVLAKYQGPSGKHFVLLVSFPNKDRAELAHKNFNQHFLGDSSSGLHQFEDGSFSGSARKGNLVIIVLQVAQSTWVKGLLSQIKKQIPL